MAKAELFKNKFFAIILKGIHAFPVKRGSADISAIKTSIKLVRDEAVLGIFPEGTRSKSGSLLPGEPGVALLAIKTNAPVIPVRISGRYLAFNKINISIGKPISFKDYDKKLTLEEMGKITQVIMNEIGKLA